MSIGLIKFNLIKLILIVDWIKCREEQVKKTICLVLYVEFVRAYVYNYLVLFNYFFHSDRRRTWPKKSRSRRPAEKPRQ